jgi:hypothetical protein
MQKGAVQKPPVSGPAFFDPAFFDPAFFDPALIDVVSVDLVSFDVMSGIDHRMNHTVRKSTVVRPRVSGHPRTKWRTTWRRHPCPCARRSI